MKKIHLPPGFSLSAAPGSGYLPARPRRRLWALLAAWLLISACGELRPVPASFEAQAYKEISYEQLRDPKAAGLQSGQLIRVPVYFWQVLEYDPAIVRNYLTLPRYPIRWYRLKWCATYGTVEMRDYFDLLAMDRDQEKRYAPKRLEHLMIYGELSPLKPGLFLRVHHLDRIAQD